MNMAPVAEWLVVRSPAPAEGEPVPDCVRFSFSGEYRDASPHPERSVLALCRVLNNNDGLFQDRLERLIVPQVMENEPARGAAGGFLYCRVPGLRDI